MDYTLKLSRKEFKTIVNALRALEHKPQAPIRVSDMPGSDLAALEYKLAQIQEQIHAGELAEKLLEIEEEIWQANPRF